MIKGALEGKDFVIIEDFKSNLNLKNKKLLFALELDNILLDIPMISFIKDITTYDNNSLKNSIGAILVNSSSELGTKNASQDLIFLCNNLGCSFLGHPIVEATKDLRNFSKWQKVLNLPLEEVLIDRAKELGNRLYKFNGFSIKDPKILILYSTPNTHSNTLALWKMVYKSLPKKLSVEELLIENGKVLDCRGCNYNLCVHYGKNNKCFYGGVMVEQVIPSIENADIIIWLCPNYNDALAANLTAVINRLTVLYNKMNFYDKALYGIVVSGNSGGDSVAKQLIGALNINKGFYLPSNSILTATANDPKSIYSYPNIESMAKEFSDKILKVILRN